MPTEDLTVTQVMEETRGQVESLRRQMEGLGSAAKLVGTTGDSLLIANQEMAALGERVTSLAESLSKLTEELATLQPEALSKEHRDIQGALGLEALDTESLGASLSKLTADIEERMQSIEGGLKSVKSDNAKEQARLRENLQQATSTLSMQSAKMRGLIITTLIVSLIAAVASIAKFFL